MLILTRSDIARLLTIESVIEVVEQAHRLAGANSASEGTRHATALGSTDALLIPMVASIGPMRASGLKLLTDSPSNPERGRPRQQSLIALLDPSSNAIEALLDGAGITRARTAAASAVATKHLAREDSSTLGLLGAGALAHAHVQAIAAVRPITKVLVWTRDPATLHRFVEDVDAGVAEVVPAACAQEVAAGSDIVCTLTPAREPILRGAWLRPGAHVNAVGAPPRPGYREIDTDVVQRSRVVVDSLPVALAESDAIRAAVAAGIEVSDELGSVVAGRVAGRSDQQQITLFNSVGLALQDLATARLVVDRARVQGLGTEIAMADAVALVSKPR